MLRPRLLRPVSVLLLSTALLAACQSPEERAAAFYQSGLELLEAGDPERALLELRNVFDHAPTHREARRLFADTLLEMGRDGQAYSQYLRLAEQYPDAGDVRLLLAEQAVKLNDWDTARLQGAAALRLLPEGPRTRALELALRYREATLARRTDEKAELAAEAAILLETMRAEPGAESIILSRLVIDEIITGDDPAAALPVVDAALARDPDARDLNTLRLRLLAQRQDVEGVTAQLRRLVELFPEDLEFRQRLVDLYLSQDDVDAAEAFLREVAGDDATVVDSNLDVVRFLSVRRDEDAARDELTRLIEAAGDAPAARVYAGVRAGLSFDAGERAAAIADLRATLDGAPEGDEMRHLQMALAQMLEATGETGEARALVDAVLESDPGQIDALKTRASWQIEADQPGAAIVTLRAALAQDARDAQTLTLMALAHERNGDTDLIGERLALAVEVSEAAPEESLRYARFLLDQSSLQTAVTVIEEALNRAPADLRLLQALARIHLERRDWFEAQSVVDRLAALEGAEADRIASSLRAEVLQGQNRVEDSLAVLETQVRDGEGADARTLSAVAQIVQSRVRGGEIEIARAYLDEVMAELPDTPDLRLMDANLNVIEGDLPAAEAIYRDMIAAFPDATSPALLLMRALEGAGEDARARAVLDEALARMPEAPELLMLRARDQERADDVEGAIATYEALYAMDGSDVIVANNLASLLSTARGDAESLERAAVIARRLRGTDVPAFQDTYGWIAHLRGDHEEAILYLAPAARAFPDNAMVQLHLGLALAGAGETARAREVLGRALELAGPGAGPRFETARETLATLPETLGVDPAEL